MSNDPRYGTPEYREWNAARMRRVRSQGKKSPVEVAKTVGETMLQEARVSRFDSAAGKKEIREGIRLRHTIEGDQELAMLLDDVPVADRKVIRTNVRQAHARVAQAEIRESDEAWERYMLVTVGGEGIDLLLFVNEQGDPVSIGLVRFLAYHNELLWALQKLHPWRTNVYGKDLRAKRKGTDIHWLVPKTARQWQRDVNAVYRRIDQLGKKHHDIEIGLEEATADQAHERETDRWAPPFGLDPSGIGSNARPFGGSELARATP